jgi:tRNA-dihydrouridine synthase B
MRIGELELARGVFLAPMEDVTDCTFRRLCRHYGADLVYTEFVSAEALIRSVPLSRERIQLGHDERPVGIQLYGNRTEALVDAARACQVAGPDLIDLNFGCPVRKIAGKGSGSGMLRDPERLVDLTAAVVRSVDVPVTVKTRLGWDDTSIVIVDLARRLEDAGIAALTIHARTRQQMLKGQADWDWIRRVKQSVSMPIIGNGDIQTPLDVGRMFDETGCDAVMIGRAAIGNPWIFRRTQAYLRTGIDPGPPTLAEQIGLFFDQLNATARENDEQRAVAVMRKHLAMILRGFPNVAAFRAVVLQERTITGIRRRLLPLLERMGSLEKTDSPAAGDPKEACA